MIQTASLKRTRILLGLIFLLAAGTYAAGRVSWLSQRTPLKLARLHSGLSMPSRVEVIRFEDAWDWQDGHTDVELQLSAEEVSRLGAQAQAAGYLPLPILGAPAYGAKGWYHLEGDLAGSFTLVVLDRATGRLRVLTVKI